MNNSFVAVLRFSAFVLWTLTLLVAYLPLSLSGWKGHTGYVRFYFRWVARILGFDVAVRGQPVEAVDCPVLYVANHASYLDIVILGGLLKACFVAKAEVSGWPGFGFLARVSKTAFVDRRRGASSRERDSLRKRIESGESLILFPEGTSNDGNRILPFKSSFFAVAEPPLENGASVVVQPVSIAYTRLDGIPMGRAFRSFYAWYGDMTLAGHLFAALGLGRATVEVIFHEPVTIRDFANRKALAHHCHDVINNTVISALCGRL